MHHEEEQGGFEGHHVLSCFPLIPLKQRHPAQQTFLFPWAHLHMGVLENKKKSEGQKPGIVNLGHDASEFPDQGLPSSKHCRQESTIAEHLWRPNCLNCWPKVILKTVIRTSMMELCLPLWQTLNLSEILSPKVDLLQKDISRANQ